ncbi:hypothetical protein D5086_010827 [Populus alba]|uniref:Uncharacterized protein n=1 Tax=Populus alba TaxID=43335 RepID=A0ACC4CAL6_POPAL
MTLMILEVCAFESLIVGIATEGWPNGAHDGLRIVASILSVVFVTVVSDYRQSLQFRDLDNEKRKITIQVTSNGFRQKLSINDLLPGDIVHLAIGDQVPANGLFVSGFSVLIDEWSLIGESEPMMVATIGMRTQWDKLMATLSEGGDDETPQQVKLNGMLQLLLFSSEGLPLPVTLSLAFSMKKMMNGKALVRHLAAFDLPTKASSLFSEIPASSEHPLTETSLLEFGLSLGRDFQAERQPVKLVRAEPFNSTKKQTRVVEAFASEALRTLCIVLESGFSPDNPLPHSRHTCIGISGIKNHLRPGVKESVAVCRSAGITVRMATGDNLNTAKAIARECGILINNGIAVEDPDFHRCTALFTIS